MSFRNRRLQISSPYRVFLLVGLTILVVVCFFDFGAFLTPRISTDHPFAFEITAAFLGTLLTVSITALLLSYQTSGEIGKAQRVKIFETKLTIYQELLKKIEDVLSDGQLEESEFFQIQLIIHKVVFIASKRVLYELPSFARVISYIPRDVRLTEKHKLNLLHAFGRLASEIRADLSSTDEAEARVTNVEEILIKIELNFLNSEQHALSSTERFFAQCTADDAEIYNCLLSKLENKNLIIRMESTGLYIYNHQEELLLHFHPVCEMPNKVFYYNLNYMQKQKIRDVLKHKRISRDAFLTEKLEEKDLEALTAALQLK